MINYLEFFIFIIFNIYVLYKAVVYGLYEIRQNTNKFGGIFVIVFSLLVVIFSFFSIFLAK